MLFVVWESDAYAVVKCFGRDVGELDGRVSRSFDSYREISCPLKTHMSETIPLRTALRVQSVAVVIRDILSESLDGVLECLTAKGWLLWDCKRETIQSMSKD